MIFFKESGEKVRAPQEKASDVRPGATREEMPARSAAIKRND